MNKDEGAAAIFQQLARLPPSENPFTFLREVILPQSVALPTEAWQAPMVRALQAIYALCSVLIAAALVCRWRRTKLTLCSRAILPSGTLVCVHPINVFFLCLFLYFTAMQGGLYCISRWLQFNQDPQHHNPGAIADGNLATIPYIALVWAVWALLAGATASGITTYATVAGSFPRGINVRLLNVVILGWPLVLSLCWLGLGIAIAVYGRRVHAGFDDLVGALEIYESEWTVGLPIQQLLSLQPYVGIVTDAYNATINLATGVFTALLAHVVVCYLVWIPTNVVQIRALRHQIRLLRDTKKCRAVTVSFTTLKTSPKQEYGAPFESPKLKGADEVEVSESEHQTRKLSDYRRLRLLVFGAFIVATLPMLGETVCAAVVVQTVVIGHLTTHPHAIAFLQFGPHIGLAALGVPLSVWFLLRSAGVLSRTPWFDDDDDDATDDGRSTRSPRSPGLPHFTTRGSLSAFSDHTVPHLPSLAASSVVVKIDSAVKVDVDECFDDLT